MKKILVICGPTATGKTKLALHLAKVFNGELISADSRQVYKGMDIGTGKDIPEGFKIYDLGLKNIPHYSNGETKIWGYDLVGPKEEFSVSAYERFANEAIRDIHERGRLPVLVGGTGLYVKGAVEGIPTSQVPRNLNLRESLKKFSVEELYEKLAELDPIKAGNMNSSDNKNPRRLVRAIEIAQSKVVGEYQEDNEQIPKNVLLIGLEAPSDYFQKAIADRVRNRISMGIINEIKKLLAEGVSWDDQSMTSLGYGIWKDYFEGRKNIDEIEKEWVQEELSYVKRQFTWFKSDERIIWIDITQTNFIENVEKLVVTWYSSSNAGN